MKKFLIATLCGLLNYCQLIAQPDSLFYFLDKTSLTNNVLCPYNDITSWGLYDGRKDQIIETKNIVR